jgi:hypothetical protein
MKSSSSSWRSDSSRESAESSESVGMGAARPKARGPSHPPFRANRVAFGFPHSDRSHARTAGCPDGSEDNTDGANVASAVPMGAIEWDGLAHLESLLRDAMAQTRRLREQSEEPRVRV